MIWAILSIAALGAVLEVAQRVHDRFTRRDRATHRRPEQRETQIDFGRRQMGR